MEKAVRGQWRLRCRSSHLDHQPCIVLQGQQLAGAAAFRVQR